MSDNNFGGTDPRTLFRSDAPGTSEMAALMVDTNKWERRVYYAVASFGSHGCILDDVWRSIVKRHYGGRPASDPIFCSLANTISGRFKALEDKGLIKYNGETRKGVSGRFSRVRVAVRSGA